MRYKLTCQRCDFEWNTKADAEHCPACDSGFTVVEKLPPVRLWWITFMVQTGGPNGPVRYGQSLTDTKPVVWAGRHPDHLVLRSEEITRDDAVALWGEKEIAKQWP